MGNGQAYITFPKYPRPRVRRCAWDSRHVNKGSECKATPRKDWLSACSQRQAHCQYTISEDTAFQHDMQNVRASVKVLGILHNRKRADRRFQSVDTSRWIVVRRIGLHSLSANLFTTVSEDGRDSLTCVIKKYRSSGSIGLIGRDGLRSNVSHYVFPRQIAGIWIYRIQGKDGFDSIQSIGTIRLDR